MRRIDEPGQPVGSAIRRLDGGREHTVVAPVADAGERCDRHHLDRRDPERNEPIELPDRSVEGSLAGERADVHLVEHGVGQLHAGPRIVAPMERRLVDDARWAVHPLGLRPRCRICQGVAVDDEPIPVAVSDPVDLTGPVLAVRGVTIGV